MPAWVVIAAKKSKAKERTDDELGLIEHWNAGKVVPVREREDFQTIAEAVQTTNRLVNKDNIDEWKENLPGFLGETLSFWTEKAEDWTGGLSGFLLEFAEDMDILPDDARDLFRDLLEEDSILKNAGVTMMIFQAIMQGLTAYITSFAKKTERKYNALLHPDLPDMGSALQNWFLNPEHRDRIKEVLLEYGIDPDDFDLLTDARRQPLDIDSIRSMQMRGIMTGSEAVEEMKRQGYTDDQVKDIQKIFWRLPGLQDVITFAVKEAFDEGAVSELGLDEEYPEELTEIGKMQGMKEEYLKYYWRAHWNLPSPTQAMEMFFRTDMTEQQLDDMLRYADYPKHVREKFLAIKHRLPTRVDIRRLLRDGHISTEDAVRLYEKMGYSEENAVNLVRLAGTMYEDSEKDLTRAQIISGYNTGVINRRDTEEMLQELGYDDDEVDFFLDMEDYKRAEEYRNKQIKACRKRFEMGIFNRDQAVSALANLDLDQERITQIIDEWELERLDDLETPTRAVLGRWLKKGVITEDQYRSEMKAIGWIDKYIDNFIQEISGLEEENNAG
jgi:hypothetical protein